MLVGPDPKLEKIHREFEEAQPVLREPKPAGESKNVRIFIDQVFIDREEQGKPDYPGMVLP